MVNVSAFPERLAAGLQQVQVGSGYTLSLIRADGAVLVRTGPPVEPGVRVPAGSPWRAQVAAGMQRATYQTADEGGGQLVALTRLGGFPIYATAQRSRAGILPLWWRRWLRSWPSACRPAWRSLHWSFGPPRPAGPAGQQCDARGTRGGADRRAAGGIGRA
ncbi:hypothetical protein ACFQU2_02860 [Siccirubricoccus deserti]